MGTTGETPRRVADFGFNPAWSPDSASIAVGTVNVERPDAHYAISELWVIDASNGARRRIVTRDAVQPAWSPDGRFIAFWSYVTASLKSARTTIRCSRSRLCAILAAGGCELVALIGPASHRFQTGSVPALPSAAAPRVRSNRLCPA